MDDYLDFLLWDKDRTYKKLNRDLKTIEKVNKDLANNFYGTRAGLTSDNIVSLALYIVLNQEIPKLQNKIAVLEIKRIFYEDVKL